MSDGKQVVRVEGKTLLVRALDDGQESTIQVPPELVGDYLQLARRPDGSFVIAGDRQAMTWGPASREWKPLCQAPVDFDFEDVACDPKSGDVLFVLRSKEREVIWRVLPADGQELKRVFNRRADGAVHPAFDSDGALYFAREGDVWKGRLEKDQELDRFILSGTRIFPLAEQETSGGTPSAIGAHQIAPMISHLLIDRSRLGGSGWGTLVRVPNGDAYEGKLPLRWEELLDLSGGRAQFAVSPEGKRTSIFVRFLNRWYLLEKPDGELVPLPNSKDKPQQ